MRSLRHLFPALLVVTILLSACGAPASPTPKTPGGITPTANQQPSPTPTPAPRTLVICLGQEPQTLYLYGGSSAAMWSVLEAIYDGPVDTRSYAAQPVILAGLPQPGDGVEIKAATVHPGDQVVDVNGDLTVLKAGVKVRPGGCDSADCTQTYDGKSDLQMDQVTIQYHLKAGLKWSDGAPLVASDSVYSYKLASDPNTPTSKYYSDRTAAYQAVDTQTVQWVGLPGYQPDSYASLFWLPLPEHAWSSLSPAELLKDPLSTEKPLGWGPYTITDWVKGDHISLTKNPLYFRADEGLPHFDQLIFRFVGSNPQASISAVLSGECDLADGSALSEEQLSTLVDLQQSKRLKLAVAQGPEWEHVDFGIRPASYDDGYNPAAGDRPDYFGDPRTRQAFALCMDRQRVVRLLMMNLSSVMNSYVPPQNPLYDPNVKSYDFNPAEGEKLLDQVGWKDTDGNPATPRIAQGVKGVPDGTPLQVNFWTTQAPLRKQVSQMLADSLQSCGIGVTLNYYTPDQLFAEGPDGPLFGRKFDLVEFTWQSGSQPLCYLFQSTQIPNAQNHWVGVNVSGYANPDFDAACSAALQSWPDQPAYKDDQIKAQEIFSGDLPVVPLFLHLQIAAARPDFCGLALDPTERSDLWNLEAFDYGNGCK
jgi:peptide/nickel transport system substrate-binding protein